MAHEYVFENKDELVNYLYARLTSPTLLKVQKSLYLLWAYYAATYGNLQADDQSDMGDYPKQLFRADFQAWRYGPVDKTVYAKQKNEQYEADEKAYSPQTSEDKDVKLFLDDLIADIDGINDFGLVELTHRDKAWSEVYQEGERGLCMNSDAIKQEYIRRFADEGKI